MGSISCLAAIAATFSLLVTSSASAQNLTTPRNPFAVYINIPINTMTTFYDPWDDPTDQADTDPWNVSGNVGFSASCDLFQTADRRRPLLFSAYYDNINISDTSQSPYYQVNGGSVSYPTGQILRAQGIGLQARFYVGSSGRAKDGSSARGMFISAAEGYYRVTGTHDSVGLSANPISQSVSENVFAPRFSVGFGGLAMTDVQLSYCPFNNLGISNFDYNQPFLLQVGLRF